MVWSLAARAGIAGARRYGLPAIRAAVNWLRKSRADKGVTVYRGEFFKPPLPKKEVAKRFDLDRAKSIKTLFPYSNPELRKLAMGRWFSNKPSMAMSYAGNRRFLSLLQHPKDVFSWGGGYKKGRIKKLVLSAKEAKLANKVANKLHGTKYLDDFFVVPKQTLKKAETDKLRTFITNFYRMIGKKHGGIVNHGGLARILEV